MNRPLPNARYALVILMTIAVLLLSIQPQVNAYCTATQIIKSDIKHCSKGEIGLECQISAQAQITLKNLEYSMCVSVVDEQENFITELTLQFKSVECRWFTQRLYYTYPVELRVITQMSCPYNEYCCGWGEHCHRDYNFALVTKESLEYPGVSDCFSGDSASARCWVLNSQPCAHYRWYLKPRHFETYEVRDVGTTQCKPYLLITQETNGSKPITREITGTYTLGNSISIETTGNYHQAIASISDKQLISRLVDPQESYLEHAARHSRPKYREIGEVQASEPYTNDFQFDEKMVECKLYHRSVECKKIDSYLDDLIKDKSRNVLPVTDAHNKIFIDKDGELRSTLITSSPLVVHLNLNRYNIILKSAEVCPQIHRIVSHEGCYACATRAIITISASSTCFPGTATVSFEKIKGYSPGINLLQVPQDFPIQIATEYKCMSDKICLVSGKYHSCEDIYFCLSEPVISLYKGNVTYIQSSLEYAQDSIQFPDLGGFLGGIFNFSWAKIGMAIGGLMLVIFFISCFLTLIVRRG